MNQKLKLLTVAAAVALGALTSVQAVTFGYDNLSTGAQAGYSEPNANNPIFGDQLNLTRSGVLSAPANVPTR